MLGKFRVWFSGLSKVGKVGGISGAVVLSLAAIGAASPQKHDPNVVKGAATSGSTQALQPKIEHKTVTATESIPFESQTVDDASLAVGTDQVQTVGVNGVKTKSYDITLTNGAETNRTPPKEEVSTQPVTKVIKHGTYVAPAPAPASNCPNGTYVNSVGNTVCSPYSAPSAPAGATAQCRDGTYSFSQSRRGTCSSHGGVATWL